MKTEPSRPSRTDCQTVAIVFFERSRPPRRRKHARRTRPELACVLSHARVTHCRSASASVAASVTPTTRLPAKNKKGPSRGALLEFGRGGLQPPTAHGSRRCVGPNRGPATTDDTRFASMCRSKSRARNVLICFFVATEFALSRRKQGFESPRERQ